MNFIVGFVFRGSVDFKPRKEKKKNFVFFFNQTTRRLGLPIKSTERRARVVQDGGHQHVLPRGKREIEKKKCFYFLNFQIVFRPNLIA